MNGITDLIGVLLLKEKMSMDKECPEIQTEMYVLQCLQIHSEFEG